MFGGSEIIVIGDMGIDIFFELDKKEFEVRHEHRPEQKKICFNYADKIPVETMTKTIAGNASNVAVGMRRLGFPSLLVSTIGKDEEARLIQKELMREGVDMRYMKQDKRTNLSFVLNYAGERTIFVYHEPRDYVLPKLPKAKFVYLTSMRTGWEAIVDDLAEYLDKTGTKFAYQPGTFQLRAGPKVAQKLLDRTEVLFVNKEEAALYTGKSVATPISQLLTAVHRLGPRIVVITDGSSGSYASDSSGQYKLGTFDVPVVERTGCGDAFATGFMAAIASGKDVPEAMRWGSFESAGVLQHIGPQAGLLRHKDLDLYGRKYPDFVAEEIAAYQKTKKKGAK